MRSYRQGALWIGAFVLLAACSAESGDAASASPAPSTTSAEDSAAPSVIPDEAVEIRIGCGNPEGAVTCDAHDYFARLVEEKSEGAIDVTVFYQSLGSEAELAQSVLSGSVDVGDMSNGNASRFSDAFQLYDLPFLFRDVDALIENLSGPLGQQAIEQFEEESGLKFLYPTTFGTGRDIQTTEVALRTPDDINGLKIRAIATPVDQEIFRAWGANPTPVDFGQLFAALQQGVVDGEQVTVSVILTSGHHEVVKHNLRIDYQMLFTVNFMNRDMFDGLTAEQQALVDEAAAETAAWQKDHAKEQINDQIAELEAFGVTVYTPTEDEYSQWASVREDVWERVADQSDGVIDLDVANEIYESQQ